MKHFLSALFVLVLSTCSTAPVLAVNYSATPANYVAVMAGLHPGDTVTWSDPTQPVPAYYDRATRTYDPPVEIDFGTATVAPQRFTNPSGFVFRGGIYVGAPGATTTGLMLTGVVANIRLIGPKFSGGRNGVTIANGRNIYAENVQCEKLGADCFDAPNVVGLEVRGLRCVDSLVAPGAHPDCFQTWGRFGEQAPTNLSFDNVYVTGPMQGVSDFVHTSAKDRPLGPDPYPVNVTITNLTQRGNSGWAISMDGCLGTCTATNVLVVPDETAKFLPKVVIPTMIGVDAQPLRSAKSIGVWTPSSTRYPPSVVCR